MKNRSHDAISKNLTYDSDTKPSDYLIFTSPSDEGVRRNLGRNGARYAPAGILNVFKKMNQHQELKFSCIQVTDQKAESVQFETAQENAAKEIGKHLKKNDGPIFTHLGGGHDHVFPLLKAIDSSQLFKKIFIINIDAHCDTRVDDSKHSGTPFRDFDHVVKTPTQLVQFGIQYYANSDSTLSALKNIQEEHIFINETQQQLDKLLQLIKENDQADTALIFSLDCDALEGHLMKAVSAVNGHGVPLTTVREILNQFKETHNAKKFYGFYEYNPIFDDLSQLGARTISSLLYSIYF